MKIVCDAVPFGFGPAGKLLTLLDRFPPDWETTFLCSGTTQVLAQRSRANRLVRCDTTSPLGLHDCRSIVASADLVITVMNPLLARYAMTLGRPVALIDSLFWMWNSARETCPDADMYFIQRFPGWEQNLSRIKPYNPIPIGAIVFRSPPVPRKRQILVHLGGMHNPIAQPQFARKYMLVVSECLSTLKGALGGYDILIAANAPAFDIVQDIGMRLGIKTTLMGHDEFTNAIATSDLLVTSPGLTATYEAFAAATPVMFLPPQNYSQLLISDTLKTIVPTLDWVRLAGLEHLLRGVPEDVGLRAIVSAFGHFRAALGALDNLNMYTHVASDSSVRSAIAKRQQRFIECHVGLDGAVQIISHLADRLRGVRPEGSLEC